CQQDFDWPPAF
nr:immunoglobulin light chain junction region [Macaca mulatta]